MRKIICKIMIVSLVASLACVACGKKSEDDKDMGEYASETFKIYYVSDDLKEILSDEFETSGTDKMEIINDIMLKMKEGNFEKTNNPTIPDNINIPYVNYNANDSLLGLVFNENYYNIDGEVLRRAAIVLTLCQLDGIDGVEFYVDGQPLMIDGKRVGTMSNETFVTDAIKIYYVSDDLKEMLSDDFRPSSIYKREVIDEIIVKLKEGNFEKAKNPTIPSNITYTSYNTNKNILGIAFDKNYYNMDGEVLRRAAIVLTLCQLEGIDYVEFYVDEQPLMINDKSIGTMSRETFVDDVGVDSNYNKKINISLYFTTSAGDKLVKLDENVDYDGKVTLEELVVTKLIEGPDKIGYCKTLHSDVGINRITVSNSRCYVDLNERFLNKCSGVSEEVAVYSIVNTLTELSTVNEVMITIDGNTVEYYQNKIRLDGFLSRNYDINEIVE